MNRSLPSCIDEKGEGEFDRERQTDRSIDYFDIVSKLTTNSLRHEANFCT